MVVHLPLLYDSQYSGSDAASAQSLLNEHLNREQNTKDEHSNNSCHTEHV